VPTGALLKMPRRSTTKCTKHDDACKENDAIFRLASSMPARGGNHTEMVKLK
jgi:hypothetical protein